MPGVCRAVLCFCDVFVPGAALCVMSMSSAASCCCILSQGACAQNLASSPHFFAVSGHDVLRCLLIGGKAFCGCSGCFIVVHCWSHPCFPYFPCSSFGVGSALCSVPCTGPRAIFACSCPSPRGWFRVSISGDTTGNEDECNVERRAKSPGVDSGGARTFTETATAYATVL